MHTGPGLSRYLRMTPGGPMIGQLSHSLSQPTLCCLGQADLVGAAFSFSFFLYWFFLYSLLFHMGISHMGNSGRFPQWKPAATESRYPTPTNCKVHAGSSRVSIIYRPLTWTTGSLTCVRDHSCACVYTRVYVTKRPIQTGLPRRRKHSDQFTHLHRFLVIILRTFEL